MFENQAHMRTHRQNGLFGTKPSTIFTVWIGNEQTGVSGTLEECDAHIDVINQQWRAEGYNNACEWWAAKLNERYAGN